MSGQIEDFIIEFFKNLKCSLSRDGDVLIVENVPKAFEDLYGKVAPYRLSFVSEGAGEFVGKGSSLVSAMTKFLEGAGKTTLLKIDFFSRNDSGEPDFDPEKEISKVISLKNCEIGNLVKKHKNNFFSRFTFMTTFRYLNESEQIVNEIYVHDGKIVKGDLSGYTVIEGKSEDAKVEHLEKDYGIARNFLKENLQNKTSEIGEVLGERLEKEIERIREHYENLMKELGGDLSGQISKIKEVELQLRVADSDEKDLLRDKLDRLRKGLLKMGDEESRDRILKEQEFTINDAVHKHSLNVDNKLVNTTVIYYPVFNFNLFLKSSKDGSGELGDKISGRYIDMSYDPLTKTLNKLKCESCGDEIVKINLCSAGHISCDNCLDRCNECGKQFCVNCLKRSCSVCGKPLCKNCSMMCVGCGKYVCKNHLRTDCVSGEDRCVSCLRACLRCHGMAQEKYFGEALDGSKVCQKCLGEEKRNKVMKKIFSDD